MEDVSTSVKKKKRYSAATKARRNANSRQARQARMAAGLCALCGKRPPEAGITRCGPCREYSKARTREQLAAGLCSWCRKQPARPAECRCQDCLNKAKNKREARRAAGLCIHCGEQRPPEHQPSCDDCRRQQIVKMRQRRLEVLTHYGLACACCGETTYEFLQIDHINNDGAKHRREVGRSLYSWLQKHGYPKGFQTLCANCNIAKAQHGICPHEKMRLENGRDTA